MWRTQPLVLGTAAVSTVIATVAVATCIQQWGETSSARSTWRELDRRVRAAEQTTAQPGKTTSSLPDFSSTQLLKALHRAADESKLPLDEVQFALDNNGNQPYLRYRATLTVSSGYSAIRRFVDRMREALPDVSLDTISCSRDDIGGKDLTCDLTLSAFYGKGDRG